MKKVVIGLLVIVALFLAVSAMLPSTLIIERSKVMAAPVENIYAQVNDLHNWGAWSPWAKLDPSISDTGYSGSESGVGAKHCWDSENENVGKGCQTITETMPNQKMVSHMEFDGQGEGTGYFNFEEVDGGTKVTWGMKSELPIMQRVMPGLFMEGWMEPVFDQGLADLEVVAQNMEVETESTYDIQKVELPAASFVTISGTFHPNEISNFLGSSYGQIMSSGVEMTGHPTALFYSYSDTLTTMDAAVPVAEGTTAGEGTELKSLETGPALKIDYYGWYGNNGDAHLAMDAYMEKHGLEMNGPVREVYVTDPGAEADTTKWLTEIYYPIQ